MIVVYEDEDLTVKDHSGFLGRYILFTLKYKYGSPYTATKILSLEQVKALKEALEQVLKEEPEQPT